MTYVPDPQTGPAAMRRFMREHPLTGKSGASQAADAKARVVSAAPFAYVSEEVAEAFTEWCAAEGVEARDDQEYRWLRQAFTAGMNETARYAPADLFGPEAYKNHAPGCQCWDCRAARDPGPVTPSPWGHPEPSHADDADEPTNRDIEAEPADWHDGPDPADCNPEVTQ